jgi:hypothetical protein
MGSFKEAKEAIKQFIGKERIRRTGYWLSVLKSIYEKANQQNRVSKQDTLLERLRAEYDEIKIGS